MNRSRRALLPSVYDKLYLWARKTTSFAELMIAGPDKATDTAPAPGELIYRLKQWPELPHAQKTADVYRTLSVMSNRPVNRHWILASSRLKPEQVDQLLARLVEQDAVEVIDASRFS